MLRTNRLLLRQWRESDLAPCAAMNADARVMEFMPKPLTRAECDAMVDRLRIHIEECGWGIWAVEAPGVADFVGSVGLGRPRFETHFTPCVEIAWRLCPQYWRYGYATEAARCALAFGFETLGLPEIVAFTVPANRRSWRVMERVGMVRDIAGDFDHPSLPEGHALRRHMLYRCRTPSPM